MKPFDFVAATSIEEAIRILSDNTPDSVPIAGGTDLLVRMKRGMVQPKLLVDIAKIPELNGIAQVEEGLLIGSMVSHAEIAGSRLIRELAPAVAAASAAIGSTQTRHLGTIGGNLVSCVPSLDSAPPLLVLDARVTVADENGRRCISLEEFFVAPRCSLLTPDELLINILIPSDELAKASSFQKFGRRKALTLSVVNAAACVEADKTDNRFKRVRLAMGAVAPTPIRARMAEEFIQDRETTPEVMAEAGCIAAGESKPIDDFRASARYRMELIKVLIPRAVQGALSGESGT